MFGFSRTTTSHPLSTAFRHLLGDGPTSVNDLDTQWVVEADAYCAGRRVTQFQIFDRAGAARASVRIRAYDDLGTYPEFVLGAGHVEHGGARTHCRSTRHGRERPRRPGSRSHGTRRQYDRFIFWDADASRSSAEKLSRAAAGWLHASGRPTLRRSDPAGPVVGKAG
jgi:hypothetical protein